MVSGRNGPLVISPVPHRASVYRVCTGLGSIEPIRHGGEGRNPRRFVACGGLRWCGDRSRLACQAQGRLFGPVARSYKRHCSDELPHATIALESLPAPRMRFESVYRVCTGCVPERVPIPRHPRCERRA